MATKPSQYAVIRDPAKLRRQRTNTARKSLRQVARDINRPKGFSFLHDLESGNRRTCTPETAWRLALALGIPMHAFEDYFELHGTTARAA